MNSHAETDIHGQSGIVDMLKVAPAPILLLLFLIAGMDSGVQAAEPPQSSNDRKGLDFFETKIRPVLVKHCYECHSAESKSVKGSLLVDSARGLVEGGDSGPAIVRGKPDESLLLEALRYESFEMPPSGRLPENVVEDFARWIERGAPDPRTQATSVAPRADIDIEKGREFWAFQPVRRPLVPPVDNASWPQSDIDRYVLAALERQGLRPAPDAPRETLIRRVYYDLIGLPPTPEQVAEFVNDESPHAFATVVDRLLDSPAFGVHWGRHWLDVARYADSNGSDFNATFHEAWRYRNYVVDAFNADKPFDTFIREQIAGDLLPYSDDAQRSEQLIATSFLMIGAKMLSERDKDKLHMDVIDEQISAVGTAFLGMTLGCARCHDHKFDPIPTRDYYALAGIFGSTETLFGESQKYVSHWKLADLPADPQHVAAVIAHEAEKKKLTTALSQAKKQADRLEAQLAKIGSPFKGQTIDDTEARMSGRWVPSTYSQGFVGTGYIHDDQAGKGEKAVTFTTRLVESAVYEVQVSYTPGGGRASRVPVTVHSAVGDSVHFVDQTKKPPIEGLFAAVGRFPFGPGQDAVVTISNRETRGHVIVDAVRFVQLDAAGQPVPDKSGSDARRAELQVELDKSRAQLKQTEADLKRLETDAPSPLPKAFAAAEAPEIGDCRLCIRGEHKQRGDVVPRGVLQVATLSTPPSFPEDASGRRELADWIAGPENPLTRRVIVNRIWDHLLGRGIVASVDNFGSLGARPTHPELLDRLAGDFLDDGWTIKPTIRRIVLSRVYQMSSKHDEQFWQRDPGNQWLWRAHRRRLPAESIRDSLLAIGGRLDLSPDQSPVSRFGVLVNNNSANAASISREESIKRSIYLPIIRNELPPMLTVFDFADPDMPTGKRPVTNVPAQALLLMNSPFVMQSAQNTADRVLQREGLTDEERLARLYTMILSRRPTADETGRALDFIRGVADSSASGTAEAAETSAHAWAQLAQVLFSSTEFRILN